jgi:hypothetical protein
VIVQIGLKNMPMRAITREKQLGGGSITDGKRDPSAFSRITDETTDAKSARGKDPLMLFKG